MIATRLSSVEYGRLFSKPLVMYDSVAFSELNRNKCDDLHYVVIGDRVGKVRFGVALGQKNGELRTPFSAPFGCIEETRPHQIPYYIEAMSALRDYAGDLGCRVRLTLPPTIYSTRSQIAKQYLAALNAGAELLYVDCNHSMPMRSGMDALKQLSSMAMRAYRASVKANVKISEYSVDDDGAFAEAYQTIKIHHETHGYPVHIPFDNLKETVQLINARVFIASVGDDTVAASINYVHDCGVAQLIYWGNLPDTDAYRPMDALGVHMIDAFSHSGLRWLDFGPSSSDGIPALGLCRFKESLGFSLFSKPTLLL